MCFKSKVRAYFISLRPLPKPPPRPKFYNGNSVALKIREESDNLQTSKLVTPAKVDIEESRMLSVLQKESKMMGTCCSSTPMPNPSELKPFVTINGLQHLAEACHFKAWFLDQF